MPNKTSTKESRKRKAAAASDDDGVENATQSKEETRSTPREEEEGENGEEAEEEAGQRSSDIGIEQDNEKVKFFFIYWLYCNCLNSLFLVLEIIFNKEFDR